MTQRAPRPKPHAAYNPLRHTSKPSGSPFKTGYGSSTMSCFLCGVHKQRSEGSNHRLLNATQFVCFDCRPAKAAPDKANR